MATHLRLNHIGRDGSNPAQRARRVRYTGSVGENIAQGALTVEQAVLVWMESRGHRENILGKYEEMGAALVVSDWGAPYWCVVLGRSRSVRSRAVSEPVRAEPAADAAAGDRINNEAAAAFVRAVNGERKDCSALIAKRRGACFHNLFVNDTGLYLYFRGHLIRTFHAVHCEADVRSTQTEVVFVSDFLHNHFQQWLDQDTKFTIGGQDLALHFQSTPTTSPFNPHANLSVEAA
jgi:hypothetical protein